MSSQLACQAVIFDLDGVLVRTAEFHEAAWVRIGREIGVELDAVAAKGLRGLARDKCLDLIANGAALSANQRAQLLDRKNELYLQAVRRAGGTIAIDGVASLLAGLRERGFKLAVASASRNADFLLRLAGLTAAFDVVSDGHFVGPAKPAAAQLQEISRRLGCPPARCVVVEDSAYGLQAAAAAGIAAIAVGPVVRNSPLAFCCLDDLAGLTVARFISILGNDADADACRTQS
ncbi:MAG: HAD family hydrolase [Alphaproteobacteria bacterium]|nr:MAG: HAD family hydrolase [Alphaproteobacteria bacterium]